jgi:hypothetical protein
MHARKCARLPLDAAPDDEKSAAAAEPPRVCVDRNQSAALLPRNVVKSTERFGCDNSSS